MIQIERTKSPSATIVHFGPHRALFSYETLVAFRVEGFNPHTQRDQHKGVTPHTTEWVASENIWSNITGKHLGYTGVERKDRVEFGRFAALREAFLLAVEAGLSVEDVKQALSKVFPEENLAHGVAALV